MPTSIAQLLQRWTTVNSFVLHDSARECMQIYANVLPNQQSGLVHTFLCILQKAPSEQPHICPAGLGHLRLWGFHSSQHQRAFQLKYKRGISINNL